MVVARRDIPALLLSVVDRVRGAKPPPPPTPPAVRLASALTSYREGLLDDQGLAIFLHQLGAPPEEMQELLLSAELDRLRDEAQEVLAVLRVLVRGKHLTPDQFAAALVQAGYTERRAALYRNVEALRLSAEAPR